MLTKNCIYFICSSKTWILTLCLTILILFYKILKVKYRRNPRLAHFSAALPGPRELLIFGNRYSFIFAGIGDIEKKLSLYTQKYGSVFRLWIKNQLVVVVSDVNQLKDIFNSTKLLDKPEIFDPWRIFLSHTIFKSEGHVWKTSRKRLQPFFKKNEIKCQFSIINDVVRQYVSLLEKHSDGFEFSIWDYLPYLGCDIFTNTYLDFQLDWNEKLDFKFQEFSRMVEEIGNSRTFIPWFEFQFVGDLIQKNRLNSSEYRKNRFQKILRDKMFTKQRELEKHEAPSSGTSRKSLELFPTLVQLQNEIGVQNYAEDEIVSFLATVSDNVSLIIGYFLLSVAMQPEIQNSYSIRHEISPLQMIFNLLDKLLTIHDYFKIRVRFQEQFENQFVNTTLTISRLKKSVYAAEKLYEELYSITGDEERSVEPADLSALTYLDQVLKETERRFPVFVFMLRKVKEDCKIGSLIYPAGTQIMIRMADVHFNPDLYPNPYKFNPDNFSSEATNKRSKYSFIPFSIGARDCLGKNFADTVMKITIVWLLRNFSFHTTSKEEDFLAADTAFIPYGFGTQRVKIKRRQRR